MKTILIFTLALFMIGCNIDLSDIESGNELSYNKLLLADGILQFKYNTADGGLVLQYSYLVKDIKAVGIEKSLGYWVVSIVNNSRSDSIYFNKDCYILASELNDFILGLMKK